MNKLSNLRSCSDRKGLASLLGFSEKQLTNILYSSNINEKYYKFSIPKKSGGDRRILAPHASLKLLQSNMAILLSQCHDEIENERVTKTAQQSSILSFSSHGFRKALKTDNSLEPFSFNIYSNAKKHINKKYVLNIDIVDFFESITFSRIVGYFHKNRHFLLDIDVAILIAQIATYRPSISVEGYLPQGSPLSPIISNLIGSILDARILRLSQRYKLDYSRYADDITLSTNMKSFPTEIAYLKNDEWVVGSKLKKAIEGSRFTVNKKKTRLYTRNKRQEVTSLTVNKKVNISKKYYRYTRSMVNEYCKTGSYSKSSEHRYTEIDSDNSLNGILSYIYYIKKDRNDIAIDHKFREYEKLVSIEKLYVKFLFHYYFIYPEKMLVVGEGVTDPLHLKVACNQLSKSSRKYIKFSYLGEMARFSKFMRFSGGTGHIHNLLTNYHTIFKAKSLSLKPCIILVDGDKAGNDVVKHAKSLFKERQLVFKGANCIRAYHLDHNLYIIQLNKGKEIEDLYHPDIKKTKIGIREFSSENDSKKLDVTKHYGKKEFYEKIVVEEQDTINFSGFNDVLATLYHIQMYHFILWLFSERKI
ncbi:retron Ec67 family RNA-directed DNA polymerase/endonuclease [Psychrobacter immobilis]|uniref:retron Ec67 family RNA-directed DNA polymerase/endonuclease n=2 Tax=Psychrobacter TaxID=497 RepID=UPI001918DF3D|nr:retron Ec67 family RNA-directed DNA polymerase/endonuclease [Psychrobacter immobilis]